MCKNTFKSVFGWACLKSFPNKRLDVQGFDPKKELICVTQIQGETSNGGDFKPLFEVIDLGDARS